MAERRNLLLETLEYLYQFYGDGQLHSLEELFNDVPKEARENVLSELQTDTLIYREGGFHGGGPMIWTIDSYGSVETVGETPLFYAPLKGRITMKGVEYLKNLEQRMKNPEHGGMNFHSIHNSNFILNSTGSTITVTNAPDQIDLVEKTIAAVKADNSVSIDDRMQILMLMSEIKGELRNGKVEKSTLDQLSMWGSVASIAAFVQPLLTAFGGM